MYRVNREPEQPLAHSSLRRGLRWGGRALTMAAFPLLVTACRPDSQPQPTPMPKPEDPTKQPTTIVIERTSTPIPINTPIPEPIATATPRIESPTPSASTREKEVRVQRDIAKMRDTLLTHATSLSNTEEAVMLLNHIIDNPAEADNYISAQAAPSRQRDGTAVQVMLHHSEATKLKKEWTPILHYLEDIAPSGDTRSRVLKFGISGGAIQNISVGNPTDIVKASTQADICALIECAGGTDKTSLPKGTRKIDVKAQRVVILETYDDTTPVPTAWLLHIPQR